MLLGSHTGSGKTLAYLLPVVSQQARMQAMRAHLMRQRAVPGCQPKDAVHPGPQGVVGHTTHTFPDAL